jgi:hypothetical protein
MRMSRRGSYLGKLSFARSSGLPDIGTHPRTPAEAGVYGSYDGFAAGRRRVGEAGTRSVDPGFEPGFFDVPSPLEA